MNYILFKVHMAQN